MIDWLLLDWHWLCILITIVGLFCGWLILIDDDGIWL